jgi:succinyl-CoA synthetase beta subunit
LSAILWHIVAAFCGSRNTLAFDGTPVDEEARMNLHEYQAKQLMARYGVALPAGRPARSVEDAISVAREIGGEAWVVKAQVHAGGRGKAGGVRRAQSSAELRSFVEQLLGSRLVTAQSPAAGLPVDVVLVEQTVAVERELYLSALVDRANERVAFIASAAGGMDIEQVAAEQPEQILSVTVDPVAGLQPYQCRRLGFGLGLELVQVRALGEIMMGLYRLFRDQDLSLVEINPLVVTKDGTLVALDAKINVDDNALYRRRELADLRDVTQEDPVEHAAAQHGLNYIRLSGEIACMVNGAGLAMATMDLIKLNGGEPANFLDVGGGTTAERVAEAFKLILADAKVKAILVNIFGGIVRCDLIAEGIIKAVGEVGVSVPVVVRLEGTNVERGRQLLADSGLDISAAPSLSEAARRVVSLAGGSQIR